MIVYMEDKPETKVFVHQKYFCRGWLKRMVYKARIIKLYELPDSYGDMILWQTTHGWRFAGDTPDLGRKAWGTVHWTQLINRDMVCFHLSQ